MTGKHITRLIMSLMMLLLIFWILTRLSPTTGLILSIVLLLTGFVITSFAIVKKHRKIYLQGLVSRTVFLLNTFVELAGILLAMILAGLFGRYAVQIATAQITHEPAKLIAGIAIALLAGTGVGLLVKRTWGRLTKA